MNKKEKQQIKYLLENLKWYAVEPNEPDYNGEYPPPMEWEQGDVKLLLKYLEGKDKEIKRLNNIINTLEDSIVGKINVLYQVKEQSNAIQELSILLKQLRELKGSDKE